MSAEEKQRIVSEKSKTACYASGYDEGTDSFNRCVAGAGLVYGEQLEREQRERRRDIGDRLGRMSEAMQAAGARRSVDCTSRRGLGDTIETTCN